MDARNKHLKVFHVTIINMFDIAQVVFPIIVLIMSVVAHEVAHGYAAYLHGDKTALFAGRLTLNPLPHIDMFGSVILPLLALTTANTFIGWAKPVPYNPYNLQGKHAESWVSSAGVLANICIALVAGVVFKLLLAQGLLNETLAGGMFTVIWINISLALFNLIPVPPFDGAGIIKSFFPKLRFGDSGFIYNPVYMIGVIIFASVLYGYIAPYLFVIIKHLLA